MPFAAVDRIVSPATPGLRVEDYALVSRCAGHGLGDPWMGVRPDGSKAVLKFVGLARGPTASRSFDEQVKTLMRVTSPNLVALRRGGVFQGWCYVVTELIEARPLDDWLAGQRDTGAPTPTGVALHLFDGLCGALQGAHRQGLAHGAVGPSTVLLRALTVGAYHPWVLDLGLGRWIRDASLTAAIEPPPAAYLAPEQEAGSEGTPRSDVFSLALVLVELLCGVANPGCGPRETFARAVSRNHRGLATHLRALRGDIHEDFWITVSSALHPDPAQRPENAQQLKVRIRAAAQNAGLWRDTPEPVAEPPPPRHPAHRAPQSAVTKTHDDSVPEGWLHSERLRVDPAAVHAMVRSTRAPSATDTAWSSGVVSGPPSAPGDPSAAPPVASVESSAPSSSVSPLDERTAPSLLLPDGAQSFADDLDHPGTERRPSLLPQAPLDPPSGPPSGLPRSRRQRAQTWTLPEDTHSAFQTLPASHHGGAHGPLAVHPGATMKVMRASVPGLPDTVVDDLEAITLAGPATASQAMGTVVVVPHSPCTAAPLPMEATVALPLPPPEAVAFSGRPRTMPPSPYAPSTVSKEPFPWAPERVSAVTGSLQSGATTLYAIREPFVLRPPDALPREKPSRRWVLPLVLVGAVVLAAVAWFIALPNGT